MELKKVKGCLYLSVPQSIILPYLENINLPDLWIKNRLNRDNDTNYHVTIINADESSGDNIAMALRSVTSLDCSLLFILGYGKIQRSDNEVHYLVIHHPDINNIRKESHLPMRTTFHITLGFKFNDIYDSDKSLKTIYKINLNLNIELIHKINNIHILEFINTNIRPCDKYYINKLKILLLNYERIVRDRSLLSRRDIHEEEIEQNIEILIKNDNYIGYYAQYHYKILKPSCVDDEAINSLIMGILIYKNEVRLQYDINNYFLLNIQKNYNNLIMSKTMLNNGDRRNICIVIDISINNNINNNINILLHEMPRNFCWIIPKKLAGISKLRNYYDVLGLQAIGIFKAFFFLEKRYFDDILLQPELKTVKPDMKPDKPWSLQYIHCENQKTPTIHDMESVLNEMNDDPVVYGCLGGFGRTGTALACYLVKYGIDPSVQIADVPSLQAPIMTPNEAVSYLRKIRPKSIENALQLSYIHKYGNHLYSRMSYNEPTSSSSGNSNSNHSSSSSKRCHPSIKLIMLVGLPAAGKSTFCELFSSCDLNVIMLNQDQLGRSECEGSLLSSIKNSDLVLLDRCNLTCKERKYWLTLSCLTAEEVLCVVLTTPAFYCIERASLRINHPTIRQGGGAHIIKQNEELFELPTTQEGFASVVYLQDEDDVSNYLKLWNCKQIEVKDGQTDNPHRIKLIKFPRTQHLINLGSATRDDLVISGGDSFLTNNLNLNIIEITEKLDGAQLGFSIDPETFKLRAQNRSHFINNKSHEQFKKLNKFIINYSQDLYNIINNNNFILFGEWLYAQHSVTYNQLPDYFLIFDLYNISKKKFYCRKFIEKKIEGTSLKLVPLLFRGELTGGKTQLLNIMNKKSNFDTENKMEGIIIKQNLNDFVNHRSKIVRSDFIAGSAHWSKFNVQTNRLKEPLNNF